jgi:hypothetical protein
MATLPDEDRTDDTERTDDNYSQVQAPMTSSDCWWSAARAAHMARARNARGNWEARETKEAG